MVSQTKKKQMSAFVLGRIENSNQYTIKEQDLNHILVGERPDLVEHPSTIDVLLLNRRQTKSDIRYQHTRNKNEGVYTTPLFFKDYETFFVRLAERGRIKDHYALKKYSKPDVDAMIHLRDLEKWALLQFRNYPVFCYYQPPTARLNEGLRFFHMGPVTLNYSHIGPDDPAYDHIFRDTDGAMKKQSLNYRLAQEVDTINQGPVHLIQGGNNLKISLLSSTPKFRNLISPE